MTSMLVALAWRNLWRQPRRTALSLFSIAFASSLLVFMLSFQLGVYAEMKESVLKLMDGYAQIQPFGYAGDPDIRKTIAHPETLSAEAREIPGVAIATPRVNAFAILASGERSFGAAVVGVDPANEAKVSSLASAIREGRYLTASDSNTAILGDTLARNLRLSVGQSVTLLGSALDGSIAADVLQVKGIYHTGIPEIDRAVLEMPLSHAQDTFGLGDRASTIALLGPTLSSIQDAMPALKQLGRRHGVAVEDWGELEPAVRDSITLKYVTSSLIYATLVIVVVFIILNTLLMSVLERTREFGMLLAIGMRPSLIGGMVWLELIALALAGGLAGIAIGGSVSLWFEIHGVAIPALGDILKQYGIPSRLYASFSLFSALAGPLAIMLPICIGGVVPYLHVRRLVAASAMRAA